MRYETSTIIKQKSGKFAKNPCNYCGDGTKADSEACEPGESTSTICSGQTKEYYGSPAGKIWNFESSASPYGKPADVTEVVNGKFSVGWGETCGANPLLYYINGNNNIRCYYNQASTSSGTGWAREYVGDHYAYCSQNTGWAYSMSELVLQINTSETGTISFNYYGRSESGSKADKMHDAMIVYLDKTTTYNGTNRLYNVDLAAYGSMLDWSNSFSKNVSAGTHTLRIWYVKDSGTDTGIDKFCIDNLQFRGLGPKTSQTTNPSNKTCNSNCTLSSGKCYNWCGDNTTQSDNGEVCDQGSSNSDNWASSASSRHCNSTCTGWAPYCGDGIVNGSEACEPDVSTRADEKGSVVCDEGGWNESDTYWRYRYTCTSSCTWTYTMTCDW